MARHPHRSSAATMLCGGCWPVFGHLKRGRGRVVIQYVSCVPCARCMRRVFLCSFTWKTIAIEEYSISLLCLILCVKNCQPFARGGQHACISCRRIWNQHSKMTSSICFMFTIQTVDVDAVNRTTLNHNASDARNSANAKKINYASQLICKPRYEIRTGLLIAWPF